MWHEYPYTDAHELNLDWFLGEFKTLVETWEQVQNDWNSLHDYVQNYFDNLNVQTEINNKINAMIADGSFALILTPLVESALPTIVDGKLPAVVASQIGAVVADQIGAVVAGQLPAVAATAAAAEVGTWLAAHIDPDTGYVIDDTLTVPLAAADAEAVGDRLNELKSIITNTQTDDGNFTANNLVLGTVTASMTPASSTGDKFKCIVLKMSDIKKYLFAHFSTLYHVLFKLSWFTSDGIRLTTMANWTEVKNHGLIGGDYNSTFPSTAYYLGITICYSTDASVDNAIENIPTNDDFYFSSVSHEQEKRIINSDNFDYACEKILGRKAFTNFEYGHLDRSDMTADVGMYFNQKYIILDIADLNDDVYIHFSGTYHLLAYNTVYDSNGDELISTGTFVEQTNGVKIANKIYTSYPTAKYVGICIKFSTSSNESDSLAYFPDEYVVITEGKDSIKEMLDALNTSKTYVVVASTGGDYTSINSAISGTNNGDTIIVMPGIYNEDVRMWNKDRHLIGLSKENCIIYSGTGLYDTPALEANIGSVENLTIISGDDNSLGEDSHVMKSYACHIEYEHATDYSIHFKNCKFISTLNSALGIGCRHNQTIVFEDCEMETLASKAWSDISNDFIATGGLLFHNDASVSGAVDIGRLECHNCIIHGKTKAIMAKSMENNSEMVVLFDKCLAYKTNESVSDVVGYWGGSSKGTSPYFCGTDIILSGLSYSNNSPELDYNNYWN